MQQTFLPWLRSHGPIEASRPPAALSPRASFRGCEATAPLKPTDAANAPAMSGAFRGCEATAPLKHPLARLQANGDQRLPWLRSHGPIEAALQSPHLCGQQVSLPWLRSHGPIEAGRTFSCRWWKNTFRGCEATAPLKRD